MGWNSWNKFACNIDEDLIKKTADKVIELGLDKLGYNYVNMDDCWMASYREDGHQVADPKKFPGGLKGLADYIHDKNLLLGVYSSAGTKTCQGLPGGLDHEVADAQYYADNEVDYLKYDNCFNENLSSHKRYPAMRDALNKTGRPIFYSLCQWGEESTPDWGMGVANSWRTTQDIKDFWIFMEHNFRANAWGADRKSVV